MLSLVQMGYVAVTNGVLHDPETKIIFGLLTILTAMLGLLSWLVHRMRGGCQWGGDDRDKVWTHMEASRSQLQRCAVELHDACEHMQRHDADAQKWMVGMELNESAQLKEIREVKSISQKQVELLNRLVGRIDTLIEITRKNGGKT